MIALERAIREVTLGVRESAIEIEYLRRAREIAADSRDLLIRLQAAGVAACARGRNGLYDVQRAQSQEARRPCSTRVCSLSSSRPRLPG